MTPLLFSISVKIREFGLFFGFVLFSLCSCVHTTSIVTQPSGADAFSIDDKGQKGTSLGKTPLTFTTPVDAVLLSKTGYVDSVIVFPASDVPIKSQYSVTLTKRSRAALKAALLESEPEVANELISDILQLQTLINENKFNETDAYIKRVKNNYEQIAVFHVLVGHFNYLKKDLKVARDAYLRALDLDRTNTEARQMLAIMKVKVE